MGLGGSAPATSWAPAALRAAEGLRRPNRLIFEILGLRKTVDAGFLFISELYAG